MMQNSYVAANSCALALALAGCSGGDQPANTAVEEKAAALQPGEYELVTAVEALRSTDKTTPATKLLQGSAPVASRTCIGPDNGIDPAAFAEAGDDCAARDPYISNGRMSVQLVCKRKSKDDVINQLDGKFTKDGFTADVTTTTYLISSGDYQMTRSITAKRVGDCTPAA
jgi:hypothetical protein